MKNSSLKIDQWLDDVASGKLIMSQRKLNVLLKTEYSLEQVVLQAHKKGVHLVQLTDDKGVKLEAASLHPFKTLC